MQGFKQVPSCSHRSMSAADLEQVVGGLWEQVSFKPLYDKDAAQARGSPLHMCTPCSLPCTGWGNSSELPSRDIARQGLDACSNDKSMFAEVRSTISSEWIEHCGAEVKPCGISLLSIQKEKLVMAVGSARCMRSVAASFRSSGFSFYKGATCMGG